LVVQMRSRSFGQRVRARGRSDSSTASWSWPRPGRHRSSTGAALDLLIGSRVSHRNDYVMGDT